MDRSRIVCAVDRLVEAPDNLLGRQVQYITLHFVSAPYVLPRKAGVPSNISGGRNVNVWRCAS
jgi:hypothetical protein